MGFGESFQESFNKSAPVATAGAMDLLKEELKTKNQKRETEALKDSIIAAAAGKLKDDPESESKLAAFNNVISKIPNSVSTSELTTVAKMIAPDLFAEMQPIQLVSNSGEVKTVGTAAKGSKVFKAALTPEEMEARTEKTEAVKYDFKRKDAFAKIGEELLAKGLDLTVDEKNRLVSAKQGQMSIQEANDLLESEDFTQIVFQAAGGTIGKLSTAGQTNLRKYNTAITDAIFNYVFAKSGAQVSDKERKAFEDIYGAKIGDNKEVVKYKASKLNNLFTLAEDILDPNKVAGLSVAEVTGRLNEVKAQLNELSGGDSKSAKIISDSFNEKIFNPGGNSAGVDLSQMSDEELRKLAGV